MMIAKQNSDDLSPAAAAEGKVQSASPLRSATGEGCRHVSGETIARVAVVILNYCTPKLVVDCLRSLEMEIDPSLDRVIVVDNQSPDDSANKIAAAIEQHDWSDWCRLERSPNNHGFAAGNNFGIARQAADYYWLLNSDTIVRPGSLQALLKPFRSEPQLGIAAPELTWPDGQRQMSCFQFHAPLGELLASAQLSLLGTFLGRYGCATDVSNPPKYPGWVSFASVLIRGDTLRDVGDLDERFFMYYEDVDYCYRVNRRGWSIRFVPKAKVVHLRGGTSPVKKLATKRKRRPAYYYASRTRYFAKHYGRLGLFLANGFWLLGRTLSLPRDLLKIRTPTACRMEWRDIWINFRTPMTGKSR